MVSTAMVCEERESIVDRFSSTSAVTGDRRATEIRELAFPSEGRSQIYKKSASIKLRPPYFGNKNVDPHHRYT